MVNIVDARNNILRWLPRNFFNENRLRIVFTTCQLFQTQDSRNSEWSQGRLSVHIINYKN